MITGIAKTWQSRGAVYSDVGSPGHHGAALRVESAKLDADSDLTAVVMNSIKARGL